MERMASIPHVLAATVHQSLVTCALAVHIKQPRNCRSVTDPNLSATIALMFSLSLQVSELRMRSIPHVPACTPLYDVLRIMQNMRCHMVVRPACQ